MVTDETLNPEREKKTSNQNEYKLPWKHFSDELFCLLSMAERTLLLYEPLRCPRWCNKISSHIFEVENLFLWCFFAWNSHEAGRPEECKLFFSGFVETNGDCMKCIYAEKNANEIFTVTASQHCSLLSFIQLVSRKKPNERQICNAIMLVRRPKLIMCDWRKRALDSKVRCGIVRNGLCGLISWSPRMSSKTWHAHYRCPVGMFCYKSLRLFGFDFHSANLLQSFYLQSRTLPSSRRALIHSIDSQSIALADLTHFTDHR